MAGYSSMASLGREAFGVLTVSSRCGAQRCLGRGFRDRYLAIVRTVPAPLFTRKFSVVVSSLVNTNPNGGRGTARVLRKVEGHCPCGCLVVVSSRPLLLMRITR